MICYVCGKKGAEKKVTSSGAGRRWYHEECYRDQQQWLAQVKRQPQQEKKQ